MSVCIKNDSGSTIPAWGLTVVSGIERLTNNRIALKVKAIAIPPTVAGRQMIVVNGATPLGVSGSKRYGTGRMAGAEPCWIAYDTADGTPAFGEMWGVENASFKLNKNKPGFEIIGLPDASVGRVYAVFVEVPRAYFKLTANLSEATDMLVTPTTANAVVLKHSTSSPGDLTTGQQVTLTSRWEDLALDSGKRGYMMWDWSIMEWVPPATECP